MASSKEYIAFVLEQCSGLSTQAMMGEYVLCYGGKVIGEFYFIFFAREIFHPKLVLDFIVSVANDFIKQFRKPEFCKM